MNRRTRAASASSKTRPGYRAVHHRGIILARAQWYSPQLIRDLFSRLYHRAKVEGRPITRLANHLIDEAPRDDCGCPADSACWNHRHSERGENRPPRLQRISSGFWSAVFLRRNGQRHAMEFREGRALALSEDNSSRSDEVRVMTCASPALICRATRAASWRASASLGRFRLCRVPTMNHLIMKIVFPLFRIGWIFTVMEPFPISMTLDLPSGGCARSVFFTCNCCRPFQPRSFSSVRLSLWK